MFPSIYRYCDYDIKNIAPNSFQRYDDLLSILCQLPENTLLYGLSRTVIDDLINFCINS